MPAINDIEEYNNSFDAALLAWAKERDTRPLVGHLIKYGLPALPSDRLTAEGAVMKMITARTALPMDVRSKAKAWLVARHLQPMDDGDVPV